MNSNDSHENWWEDSDFTDMCTKDRRRNMTSPRSCEVLRVNRNLASSPWLRPEPRIPEAPRSSADTGGALSACPTQWPRRPVSVSASDFVPIEYQDQFLKSPLLIVICIL